jgi:hypothetical protein
MEVGMYIITSAWTGLLQQVFPIFTTPTAQNFLRLITGWILCTARRTVTGMIPFADAVACLRRELWKERINCMFGKISLCPFNVE